MISAVQRKGVEQAIFDSLSAGEIKISRKGTTVQVRLCDGRRAEELPLKTVYFDSLVILLKSTNLKNQAFDYHSLC